MKQIILLILICMLFVFVGLGTSGELNPIEPPMQNSPNNYRGRSVYQESQGIADESVYKSFKKKFDKLKNEEKKELRSSLQKKRESAIEDDNFRKAEYYSDLLKLLK